MKTSREKKQQAAFYQLDLRAVKKYRQKQLLDIKVGIVRAIDWSWWPIKGTVTIWIYFFRGSTYFFRMRLWFSRSFKSISLPCTIINFIFAFLNLLILKMHIKTHLRFHSLWLVDVLYHKIFRKIKFIRLKIMRLWAVFKKNLEKKYFFTSLKSMKKRVGSGAKDPQHWMIELYLRS